MGHLVTTGAAPQGRSGIFKVSGLWPAGVPNADYWWDARTIGEAGFSDGADVGNPSPANDWVDRNGSLRVRQTGGFEPHYDAVVSGFGGGDSQGVLNLGNSPDFELLQPYDPVTSIDWPDSGTSTDPCSIGWIGRFTNHTSVIGDEATSVSSADQVGMYDSGADTIIFVNNGASTLTVGTITGVQPPFNTICFVTKRSQTDWHSWHNGTKVGNGIGTLGSSMNFTRLLRARASSAGQPLGDWTCVHFFIWHSTALSDANVNALNTHFNAIHSVY